jgi:hypothetical protein
MTLRASIAAAASSLLLVAGCATGGGGLPIGGASYQAGTDFSRYQTFDFFPVPSGGARIAATLTYFGVDGVIDRDLGRIGLARSIGGSPDLLVAYFQGGTQVDPSAWGYTTAGNPVIDVIDVPSSCLVVDLVDASTKVLVWRGIATDALLSADSVDPAVRQMLQGWPGRQGQPGQPGQQGQ